MEERGQVSLLNGMEVRSGEKTTRLPLVRLHGKELPDRKRVSGQNHNIIEVNRLRWELSSYQHISVS
jgi:hypothetical protein